MMVILLANSVNHFCQSFRKRYETQQKMRGKQPGIPAYREREEFVFESLKRKKPFKRICRLN